MNRFPVLVSRITHYLLQRRGLTLAVWLLLSGLAAWYVKNHLGVNTDTKDMLSAELNWRQLDLEHDRLFPQLNDNILIVIDAPSPDQAADAALAFHRRLSEETDIFPEVYYSPALPYLRKNALLYETVDALDTRAERLAEAQPFISRLAGDPSLRGLDGVLDDAIQARTQGQDIELRPLLNEIHIALTALLEGERDHTVSWQRLFSDDDGEHRSSYQEFITVKAQPDYSSLFPAAEPISRLRTLVKELGLKQSHAADVRLSGGMVLSHEELQSVANANWNAILLSLLGATFLLLIGLGGNLIVACMLNLLCGLLVTTAFAILTVGELNLISVAFAVLYIGLGIDFAIHYTLRYRELLSAGATAETVLVRTSMTMTRPLCLCACTTAMGFFSFMPTDYTGIAELGWIAGGGMFISLGTSFTLLPVLLSWSKAGPLRTKGPYNGWLRRLSGYPVPILSLALAGVLLLFSLLRLPDVRFDTNTLNLQDPANESVQVYQQLLADPDTSPWTLTVLARSHAQAARLAQELKRLPTVEKVVWLDSFVPDRTEEKLAVIDDIYMMLGDTLAVSVSDQVPEQDEELAAMTRLSSSLDALDDPDPLFAAVASRLRASAAAVQDSSLSVSEVRRVLFSALPGRLEALSDALDVGADVQPPAVLSERWLSQGTYQLSVYPRRNIVQDDVALEAFISAVREVHQQISGALVIQHEAGNAVKKAFLQAFIYALLAIALLLLLLLRSFGDSLLLLSILLLSACYTGAAMSWTGMSFNFANIIALPLLLGIGVDSGIHILDRYRQAGVAGGYQLWGSATARGILISTLTTVMSIGSLAFSSHQGTASMGLLLVMGVSIMVCCTLFLLPMLLDVISPARKPG